MAINLVQFSSVTLLVSFSLLGVSTLFFLRSSEDDNMIVLSMRQV